MRFKLISYVNFEQTAQVHGNRRYYYLPTRLNSNYHRQGHE